MGCIYKRGNIYWIKYYRNGKPFRESTRSRKEPDAKRLLKKREGEISQGKLPGIYYDRIRFDELAEDFLRDYQINNKKSFARAEYSVRNLMAEFEGTRVPDITTDRIKQFITIRMESRCNACGETFLALGTVRCPQCGKNDLMQGAANSTINRDLSALKRILHLGAQQTPPKVDRVPYIPLLKENNTRKGFLEHGEFLALRDALPDHLKGVATFGYKVGWRVSEITNLTWNRVDIEQGIVRLEAGETKNDDARTIYLDDELKEVFQKQWAVRKEKGILLPYIFLNNERKDRVKRFDKAWKKACEDAGIGVRLFHDLRRTAVRNMVRAGIPERVAMMISGHKTRSVFDRYNIVNDQDLKLAAQKQEAYLRTQMGTITGTIHQFGQKTEASGKIQPI